MNYHFHGCFFHCVNDFIFVKTCFQKILVSYKLIIKSSNCSILIHKENVVPTVVNLNIDQNVKKVNKDFTAVRCFLWISIFVQNPTFLGHLPRWVCVRMITEENGTERNTKDWLRREYLGKKMRNLKVDKHFYLLPRFLHLYYFSF